VKRVIAVLFGVAALLLPVAGVTAQASTPPGHAAVTPSVATTGLGPYQLLNYHSAKCAGLYGTSLTNNTVFTQYSCGSAGFNDEWYLIPNFSGSNGTWYQLQNAYSGKCAMPINYSTAIGADVVQVTCTPPASSSGSCSSSCSVQLWRIENSPYSSLGYYYYYNRYSNLCMDVDSGSTLDGAHIHQTNCGSSRQADLWYRA
jgi:hypothetical protein